METNQDGDGNNCPAKGLNEGWPECGMETYLKSLTLRCHSRSE